LFKSLLANTVNADNELGI